MGKRSRRKGAGFEREAAELLRPLWPGAKRGLGQARSGGEVPDVAGTPFWVEVKRGNSTSPRAAMRQAIEAAKGRAPPLVVYRDDGEEATVVLRLADFVRLVLEARAERGTIQPSGLDTTSSGVDPAA